MQNELRVAGIVKESIVDGPGIRMVVFAQGCNHHCPGCHNPETHAFEGGQKMNIEEIIAIAAKNPMLDGITLSGGEPFAQAGEMAALACKAKALGLNIVTYTGYTYEYISKQAEAQPGWQQLLKATDILVDGPYIQEKRNLLLKFRGSENQRMIDLKKTMKTGTVILI